MIGRLPCRQCPSFGFRARHAVFRFSSTRLPSQAFGGRYRILKCRRPPRFPSAAFRDVGSNALNYRRFATSGIVGWLTPRLLRKVEWPSMGPRYASRTHDDQAAETARRSVLGVSFGSMVLTSWTRGRARSFNLAKPNRLVKEKWAFNAASAPNGRLCRVRR